MSDEKTQEARDREGSAIESRDPLHDLIVQPAAHPDFAVTREELLDFYPAVPQEKLLRTSMEIVKEYSPADPLARFAIFGSELQTEYGKQLEQSLTQNKDPAIRKTREGLNRLLEAVDSIDFTNLFKPQGGFFGYFQTTPEIGTAWAKFAPKVRSALQKVKRQEKNFAERVDALENVKRQIQALEHERTDLLESIHAHILAASVMSGHLPQEKRECLQGRIISLQTTYATAATELCGDMLTMIIDTLIGNIRDVLLTWVPIWLSTLNDAVMLIKHQQLTPTVETYQRLIEARKTILALKEGKGDV